MNGGKTDQMLDYDAGDFEQVKGRKERQKTRDLQKRAALRSLMSDSGGRMWVWDLLSLCGVYHASFSSDALVMAFNEGRRDIGNHLIAEINRLDGGAELYRQMATEIAGR
ncbi:MAG: hypothetical protein P4L43_16600 [Syntrophobacteraceae bacterium]|nr:hypothetical protein [Syntrophobacteraceae bacterium]